MNKPTTVKKYQRRNYYIDKDFQTKFIIKFCLIVAGGSVLTAVLVYWLAQHSTTVSIIGGRVAVHTTAEYLMPLLAQTLSIELVVVALATALMTLFISHKIAGPLYRLKVSLRALGTGDLGSVRLRQGDQLKEVAASYNEAMEGLNEKVRMMKNASSLEEVKRILNTFKGL